MTAVSMTLFGTQRVYAGSASMAMVRRARLVSYYDVTSWQWRQRRKQYEIGGPGLKDLHAAEGSA